MIAQRDVKVMKFKIFVFEIHAGATWRCSIALWLITPNNPKRQKGIGSSLSVQNDVKSFSDT